MFICGDGIGDMTEDDVSERVGDDGGEKCVMSLSSES